MRLALTLPAARHSSETQTLSAIWRSLHRPLLLVRAQSHPLPSIPPSLPWRRSLAPLHYPLHSYLSTNPRNDTARGGGDSPRASVRTLDSNSDCSAPSPSRRTLQRTVAAAAAVVGTAAVGEAVGLDGVVSAALTTAIAAAVASSALSAPLSPEEERRRRESALEGSQQEQEEWQGLFEEDVGGSEGLRWTLLTLVGCVPLLNWAVRCSPASSHNLLFRGEQKIHT